MELPDWLQNSAKTTQEQYRRGVREFGSLYEEYVDETGEVNPDVYEENLEGLWDSKEEYARETADDLMSVSDLAPYVDWDRLGSDLMNDRVVIDVGYRIAVFR